MSEPLSFEDAMGTSCGRCYVTASRHRITTTGALYCLELNPKGEREADLMKRRAYGFYRRDIDIYRWPVKYLLKGEFNKEVGQAINKGLTTYE